MRTLSKQTKEAIGAAMKKRHLEHPGKYGFKNGVSSWMKGKTLSDERISKMKVAVNKYWSIKENREKQGETAKKNGWGVGTRFKKGEISLENHPNWKGGHMGYWKDKALKRDNYTCQHCGNTDREVLEVDHDIPASVNKKLSLSIDNLITLCANCHRRKTNRELRNGIYKIKQI